MGMSGRLAEYADGMTSVDMNLSDDGSTLTIVLRNLNSDTGGDDDNVINTGNPSVMKAADPTLGITSTDIYFTISEVGTTVNELAENYASSYVPSIAYDSYLTDTLVGTLRHNIKATSNISYHLGDKTTNGVVTTVITSSAYSSRLSISDVEFGFLSLTCGADSYAYLNQIGFDNKITSSQTTNPYDGYYSPSVFNYLSCKYFGTNDKGATYKLLDSYDNLTVFMAVITGYSVNSFDTFTLNVTNNEISSITIKSKATEDDNGESSYYDFNIVFSEKNTAVAETLSPHEESSSLSKLSTALTKIQTNNYKVNYKEKMDNEEDIQNQGIYTIDRKKKAAERSLTYSETNDETGETITKTKVEGWAIGDTETKQYVIANINGTDQAIIEGVTKNEAEEGDVSDTGTSYLPTFNFSPYLFTVSSTDPNTYILDNVGLVDGLAYQLDCNTGRGDAYCSINDGLSIALGADGNISSFTYYYDSLDMGFETGSVTGTITEIGTASIATDLTSIHYASSWDEEFVTDNSLETSLLLAFGTKENYEKIPFIHSISDEWAVSKDEDTGIISMTNVLGEGQTLDQYIAIVEKAGYTKDATYTEEGHVKYKGDTYTLVIGYPDADNAVSINITKNA